MTILVRPAIANIAAPAAILGAALSGRHPMAIAVLGLAMVWLTSYVWWTEIEHERAKK